MPELPEVETTKQGIAPHCEQQIIEKCIIRQPKLRWPVDETLAQKLPGLAIEKVNRRGKYLLLSTQKGVLMIHLGMSGNLRVLPQATPVQKHDHIDLLLQNGLLLRYHDPRRFGAWLWTEDTPEHHPLLKKLGPEPLNEAFNAEYLFQKSRNRRVPIKSFIMNSHIVVGAGNIYANEALFMSQIHPLILAKNLNKTQITALTLNIKKVLTKAIEQGGTTLKDFLTPTGKPGYFEQKLQVYGREGQNCLTCQTPIQKVVIAQRASFFCPQCQPEK